MFSFKVCSYLVNHEFVQYDFVDELFPSNSIDFEGSGVGKQIDKFQVDASVVSQEEEDDGADFNMIPPLSRRFFAKAK